jgi:CheY-like chemotaxis protein
MRKSKIFFVDDEVAKTKDYRSALEKHFEVVHLKSYNSIDELLQLVISEGPSVYVQDLMMPRGEDQKIDVRAGIEIAEALKETLVKLSIPLVLFSNRMLSEFEEEVRELGFPPKTLFVKFKPNTGYADFADFIKSICLNGQ